MAKDDYFVLAYRLLSYLYACLKSSESPDMEYLQCGTKDFPIAEPYWEYLLEHLLTDGYVEGIVLVPVIGRTTKLVKLTPELRITPDGIQFLQENTAMQRAAQFLKSIKETIPGL